MPSVSNASMIKTKNNTCTIYESKLFWIFDAMCKGCLCTTRPSKLERSMCVRVYKYTEFRDVQYSKNKQEYTRIVVLWHNILVLFYITTCECTYVHWHIAKFTPPISIYGHSYTFSKFSLGFRSIFL